MPHLFSFASHGGEDSLQEMGDEVPQKQQPRRPSLLKNLGGFWRRQHHDRLEAVEPSPQTAPPETPPLDDYPGTRRSSLPDDCPPRRAVPSLPRPQTFRRQESERREKLLEVPPSPTERRAVSVDRRRGLSASAARRSLSPKPLPIPSVSAPDIVKLDDEKQNLETGYVNSDEVNNSKPSRPDLPPLEIPDQFSNGDLEITNGDESCDFDQCSLQEEYDRKWILNMGMQFRDKSEREKFFVTYMEMPTKSRRLTISLDYRNAAEGSLEADLSTLHYQRDKSLRIYEAIRESLPEIQYYPTVTNLKLETTPADGQLHVHVREDINEIIQFPNTDLFGHVQAPKYRESDLEFISHLSGFVYKVRIDGRIVIKKEIPGPDTVDEFLYEVNALDSLSESRHVVPLEGLVTDESGMVVKGLLIAYASQGALVDLLWDLHDTTGLPWYRREKWANQIVEGLSDIHEAGYVQGDFTLSNVVIDENDDALIIDINRRGCPVGWEPPELSRLIDSGQRISMCISVKTDLFQLGMVLWALAEVVDEPEREPRPLPAIVDTLPAYFRHMVEACLNERPQGRPSAKRLLRQFPPTAGRTPSDGRPSVDFAEDLKLSDHSVSTHRSDKEYIDPDMAVTLEDVNARNRRRRRDDVSPFTSDQVMYFDPHDPDSNPASSYRFGSSGSWIVPRRGRSPVSSRRRRSSPYARTASSSPATSLSRSPPSRSRRRCGSESSENDRVEKSQLAEPQPPDTRGSDDEVSDFHTATPRLHAVANKHLTAVQDEDFRRQSPLLHTDSGFDEHMVEDLDLGAPEEPAYPSSETTSNKAPEHTSSIDSANSSTDKQPPPSEVETPGSFHTPLASPEGELGTQGDQQYPSSAIMTTTQHETTAHSESENQSTT